MEHGNSEKNGGTLHKHTANQEVEDEFNQNSHGDHRIQVWNIQLLVVVPNIQRELEFNLELVGQWASRKIGEKLGCLQNRFGPLPEN